MQPLALFRDQTEHYAISDLHETLTDVVPASTYFALVTTIRKERVLRVLRALAVTCAFLGIAIFLFLTTSRPHHADYWLLAGLIIAFPGLALCPFIQIKLSRTRILRAELARRLYARGMTLDDGENLITDEPHARIVMHVDQFSASDARWVG